MNIETIRNDGGCNKSFNLPVRKVRIKMIVLPTEHGSWGFVFEPLIAICIVAPTFASLWISLFFVGSFLTRQPLKIFLNSKPAPPFLPQTKLALKFTCIFGAIAMLGLIGSIATANIIAFAPFLLVAPFAVYQIYCDATKRSRNLVPELMGAIAVSSSSAIIALAGGMEVLAALAIWTLFMARLIPSIIYVRNRLRMEKGKAFSIIAVVFSAFFALCLIGGLVAEGLLPNLSLLMFGILFLRAVWGVSPYRKRVKAVKIGIWEVIYGVLTALSLIIGYYFKI